MIQARYGWQSEPAREGPACDRQEVRDPLEAKFARSGQRRGRQAQRGDRQRAECLDCAVRLDASKIGFAETGQRVGGPRSIGDRDARGEACTTAKGEQTTAEPLFSTVEVVAASKIKPKAISRSDSRNRRPAPYRQQSEAIEECCIGFRLERTKVEIGHQRAGVGGGHTGMDAERLRTGAGSDDLLPPADLADESKRRMLDWYYDGWDDQQRGHLRLVRVACRFRSPAKLAHGRLCVNWKRRDLRLDLFSRLRVGPRPPGTRPPTAAPRHRTGTRVVVDWQLQGGPLRRPRSGPFQPSQPLDGQVRQEQRDDPSHRCPPV